MGKDSFDVGLLGRCKSMPRSAKNVAKHALGTHNIYIVIGDKSHHVLKLKYTCCNKYIYIYILSLYMIGDISPHVLKQKYTSLSHEYMTDSQRKF